MPRDEARCADPGLTDVACNLGIARSGGIGKTDCATRRNGTGHGLCIIQPDAEHAVVVFLKRVTVGEVFHDEIELPRIGAPWF